jgi:hypothetical protein
MPSQLQLSSYEAALRAKLKRLLEIPDLRHDNHSCEQLRDVLLGLRFIRLEREAMARQPKAGAEA